MRKLRLNDTVCSYPIATQYQDWSSSLSRFTFHVLNGDGILSTFHLAHSRCSTDGIIIHTWQCLLKPHAPDSAFAQHKLCPAPASALAMSCLQRKSPQQGHRWHQLYFNEKSLWASPGLSPQVNSFLSAVEYFIFPISEFTYVKKEREKSNQPSSGLQNK